MTSFLDKCAKGIRVFRRPAYRRALMHGVAATIEHERIPLPGDIATVIDVGANRGQFMIFACWRFPNAAIHSFEPLDLARERLESLVPKRRDVTTYGVALSSVAGDADFTVTADDDSSSLLQPSRSQTEMFPRSRASDRIRVETARLDDTIDAETLTAPVLMKLDVQGMELEVLKGAVKALKRTDYVLVECSFVELYEGQPLGDEIIDFLDAHGFSVHGFYSPSVNDGQLIQADALLTRREEPSFQ